MCKAPFVVTIAVFIGLFSCQNEAVVPAPSTVKIDTSGSYQLLRPQHSSTLHLVIAQQSTYLRKTPRFNGLVLEELQKGDSVCFEYRLSYGNSSIKITDTLFNEPWLLVSTPTQQNGWVFGGNIVEKASEHPQIKANMIDQRTVRYFGASMAQQISLLAKEMQQVATLPGFRQIYSRSANIKDSLELKLTAYLQLNRGQSTPDFYWLNDLLNGLTVYYIEQKNHYYLYRDFKYWHQLSLKTLHENDNLFTELMCTVYAADSIEYWYPSWQLEINDTTVCSLMGTGIHTAVLDKLACTIDHADYFKAEIAAVKSSLIFEMSTSKRYWLAQSSVLKELNAILLKNYSFLNEYDKKALKNQVQLLEKPDIYGLELNYFEGLE